MVREGSNPMDVWSRECRSLTALRMSRKGIPAGLSGLIHSNRDRDIRNLGTDEVLGLFRFGFSWLSHIAYIAVFPEVRKRMSASCVSTHTCVTCIHN